MEGLNLGERRDVRYYYVQVQMDLAVGGIFYFDGGGGLLCPGVSFLPFSPFSFAAARVD
jgi:hypothetical protein